MKTIFSILFGAALLIDAHAASVAKFPAIALGGTTNQITDNGSGLTRNGVVIGGGGGGSGSTNWVDSGTNVSLAATSSISNGLRFGTNSTSGLLWSFPSQSGSSTNLGFNSGEVSSLNEDGTHNEILLIAGYNMLPGPLRQSTNDTAIGLGMEGKWDNGPTNSMAPYTEFHMYFITTNGVQMRPWSWRLNKLDYGDWNNLIYTWQQNIFDPKNGSNYFSVNPTQMAWFSEYNSGLGAKFFKNSNSDDTVALAQVGGDASSILQISGFSTFGVPGAAFQSGGIDMNAVTTFHNNKYIVIQNAGSTLNKAYLQSGAFYMAGNLPINWTTSTSSDDPPTVGLIKDSTNTLRVTDAGSGTGHLKVNMLQTSAAAPTVASASTIAPTTRIAFVSGTTTIDTITAPSPISATGGQITLIPTGLWSTSTSGNVALSVNAVVGQAITFTYDATTTKWYPALITPTTALNATYYPYTATTRVVGAGDSLMSGANNGTNGTILTYYNNFASSSSGGATNAARFGATIEQIYTDYTTYVQPLKPASGTNALLLVYMGYNNIGQGTTNTAANVWAGISNYWNAARADGFDVVGFTIPSSQGLVLSNEVTRATVNALMRHATNCTRLVDVDRLLLSSGNGPTADGLHWTTNYNCVIASNVFQVVTAPRQALRPESVMNLRKVKTFTECTGVDGTGCTRGTSTTDFKFGLPTFSGSAARGGNYAMYRWTVPYDLDVTQPIFASLGLLWNAADTGTQIYDVAIAQLFTSGADAGPGAATTMTFAADASGANGDYQHLGGINLDWSGQLVPGLDAYIIVTRQGNVDTSTQTSTAISFSIGYGTWP